MTEKKNLKAVVDLISKEIRKEKQFDERDSDVDKNRKVRMPAFKYLRSKNITPIPIDYVLRYIYDFDETFLYAKSSSKGARPKKIPVHELDKWNIDLTDEQLDSILKQCCNPRKERKNVDKNTAFQSQVNKNKEVAVSAARITAGKAINKQAMKTIKPQLPMFVKGYADSELAHMVVANVVGTAIKYYVPDNKKANEIADMMLEAAAVQALDSFDIEGMVDKLTNGVKLPAEVKKSLKETEAD